MATPLEKKSTVTEIRQRFDDDVERFSTLETGQQAMMDAPLVMELITRAALACTPRPKTVLDIGCGAGNNTLKLLQWVSPLDCDLVDLSRPMLNRAVERIAAVNTGVIRSFQDDIRSVELPDERYDVVLAAAVLHHLREDQDWETVFRKLYRLTASGGSVWITDLVWHEHPGIQRILWDRYGDYLSALGGNEYRDKVLAYIDKEDSPRPVTYQLELLRRVGFRHIDILHKNACFAAFGAWKSG